VYIRADSPTVLRGVNTKFTTQLAPKKQVMLGKSFGSAAAEIVEIISDTEARLKKEFGGESGRGTNKILDALEERKVEGLEYKVLPYVDQSEMYGAVYEKLKQGGCIGIFPEGSSFSLLRYPG
jgi:glycerol-3-phosphate O-acyltransferase / dihydroxyacetone phosphate acyltransferase